MRSEQVRLRLPAHVLKQLRAQLPTASEAAVAAIVAEVPSYSRAFAGPMGETITQAVLVALRGFLSDLGRSGGTTDTIAVNRAYELGRGEARAGRSMDALLAAYRVGARISWQAMSSVAVEADLDAERLAVFADLVFAYIDRLSASSVVGHSDELQTSGRVRERLQERVARLLVSGSTPEALKSAAERAAWALPKTVTAVLVGQSGVRRTLTDMGARGDQTLVLTEDPPGLALQERALLLVPDARRSTLRRALGQRSAVLGPTVPLARARSSVLRALRADALRDSSGLVDTDEVLGELVLGADPDSRTELRARVLRPLDHVRASTREKLEQTLRMWLLSQGRRDLVAAALFVHPQTVRYRMGLIREHFGDRLDDPGYVRDLVIALG